MDLSLLAALIALLILIADPLVAQWNRALFRRDKAKPGARDRFTAALRRRARYKTASLLFLIIASLLEIYSSRREMEMSGKELGELSRSLEQINTAVASMGERTARIEQFLWGRGGDGDAPPDEPHGPVGGPDSGTDALTFDERLSRMERNLEQLSSRAVSREEFEELQEEVIQLKKAVAEYEEMMTRIGGMPAG